MKKSKKHHSDINDSSHFNNGKEDRSPKIPQRGKLKNPLTIYNRELTEKQKEFMELATNKQAKLIFISGPAGTAKTYMAVQASLQMMSLKELSDLIYVRSAVESADSKLGFLPGEVGDKMAPYLEPLMEKLEELLPRNDIDLLKKEARISGIPVGHLRGLSLNVKAIIGDECIAGNHYIQTVNGKIKLSSLYQKFISCHNLPEVVTFNEKTKQFENKKILNVVNKGKRSVISVILGNRNIICTPDHKFLTEVGWVEAEKLNPFTPVIANNEVKFQTLDVLNDDQLQVFLGSFLGDGNVQKVGNNRYRLRVLHGIKQKKYCDWKSKIFNTTTTFIPKNGFSNKPAIKFTTKCFSLPSEITIDKKKTCPQWILDKLDARGIAIWYMDDGSINKSKNRIEISTCSFDFPTQLQFISKFKSLGIDCKIEEEKGVDYHYYNLCFDSENTKKFLDLIRPYIHENLNYKIDFVSDAEYEFNNSFMGHRHVIPDRVTPVSDEIEVYDIEVEDNHNFIITSGTRGKHLKSYSGVVAHNCQNMTFKEILTLITRTGERSKVFIIGDPAQSDINGKSGFNKMIEVFNDQESRENGIYVFKFDEEDIVRSGLVRFIAKKVKNSV